MVFHAYFYWGFQYLKGSLRDVFISRSGLKGSLIICDCDYEMLIHVNIMDIDQ
jgi:hypothetical protein